MRRAIERALATRTYSRQAWNLAIRLSHSKGIAPTDYLHRFFDRSKNPKKWLVVLFTSNRGLCGAFNMNVTRKVFSYAREKGVADVEVICVGKKGVSILSGAGIKAKQAYEKDESADSPKSIMNVANYVYEKYKNEEVDKVLIAHTQYISSLVQQPVLRVLFPFKEEYFAPTDEEKKEMDKVIPQYDYLYEPSTRKVLSYLIPRLGEVRLYEALLESNASEHSARMLAMKNASDAAGDMLEGLVLQYNRARQASITQEIAEISAGMAAVT